MTSKLHELQAEQIGAQTGELYEYQYHQAANATLLLLDGDVQCVYCEWHDDFVLESVAASYDFHQVKTRTKKSGPWRISDFFGTPRKSKNVKPADPGSYFLKMFKTWLQFESSTRSCLFVSDNLLDATFESLVDMVRLSTGAAAAAADPVFKFIVDSVSQVCADVTTDSLFRFLRLFKLQPALGTTDDLQACRAMIGDRMMEVSEVDVLISETRQMTVGLVSMVRKKSHHKASVPVDPDLLRKTKAVTLPELLDLLSLSPEGYRELKETGRTAIRTLSRLHRWCQKLGWPKEVIPYVCGLKAGWHVWWHANRHVLTLLDELALRSSMQQILVGQSRPGGTIESLISQARLLADKHAPELGTTPPLSAEILVGLALDMAVSAQGGGTP